MRLLDRYVIRNFLQAYVYCIVGFISIWLIFDISDNISTFLEDRVSFGAILRYYIAQVPAIIIVLLPVALLLALLFCLGRMSRTNEIVSMLTAGVSIPRVIAPLALLGLLTTVASTVLNYSMAPHAGFAHKAILEGGSRRQQMGITGQIFRNRTDDRTWYVQQFFPGSTTFNTVQVMQQDDADNVLATYYASVAIYHPENKTWELQRGREVHYDATGNIVQADDFSERTISNWTETPFRLSSANLRAEYLSVPELRDYLQFNSDFPSVLLAPFATHLQHRFALPWQCAVIVLIAAPLGIGYSRRGILSSVAAAVVLVFSMNFLTHLFLALGEGARISPTAAAWTPDVIFALIGFVLLYYRSSNRERPRLNPFAWRRLASA